jgi:hypothetical protein
MTAELFTEKHARKGLQPAGLRDGTKLKRFQYVDGFLYPFIGVDTNGVQHAWKGTGHKNGKKNNMYTDLVLSLNDPDKITIYLAVTSNGNGYANKDLDRLKLTVKSGAFDIYDLLINLKNGTGVATKIEHVENK